MKKNKNIKKVKLFNHIHKVKKKNVEKIISGRNNAYYNMLHVGELMIIIAIGFSSLLFANFNSSYVHLHRNTSSEISQMLAKSITEGTYNPNESKIISVWEMDGNVNNTFAAGYCTYGAARISPEFFPYSKDKMSQERTRGGNAIDRCENAKKAGFKVGSTPSEGSLIVYKKIGSNVLFGHVGKVMYHNKTKKSLIVRDMNRIGKFIMSDRWEDSNNENIKCYIYPQKEEVNIVNPNQNNDKFDVGKNETIKPEIKPTETTKPEVKPTEDKPIIENKPIEDNTHNSPNIEPGNSEKELDDTQEKENTDFHKQTIIENEITIDQNNQNFSDITKHFLSIYNMKIKITKNENITINENIKLEIVITDKNTQKNYEGVLPFVLNSIADNNNLEGSLKTVQLINKDGNIINFKTKTKGTSSIILIIDDQKIAMIPITIN